MKRKTIVVLRSSSQLAKRNTWEHTETLKLPCDLWRWKPALDEGFRFYLLLLMQNSTTEVSRQRITIRWHSFFVGNYVCPYKTCPFPDGWHLPQRKIQHGWEKTWKHSPPPNYDAVQRRNQASNRQWAHWPSNAIRQPSEIHDCSHHSSAEVNLIPCTKPYTILLRRNTYVCISLWWPSGTKPVQKK